MPRQKKHVLSDDRSRHLDRFGLVLILTVLAIVALALVDLTAPSGDLVAGIASVTTTVIVGATLLLALRASGLAFKWRRVADILIGLVIALVVAPIVFGLITDLALFGGRDSSRPLTLLVLAVLAP